MRPIDADELCRNLTRLPGDYVASFAGRACLAQIENAPTLDCEPVRHGEWTLVERLFQCGEEGKVYIDWHLECSECGRAAPVYGHWPPDMDIKELTKNYPYCHCGAKMDGRKEDG